MPHLPIIVLLVNSRQYVKWLVSQIVKYIRSFRKIFHTILKNSLLEIIKVLMKESTSKQCDVFMTKHSLAFFPVGCESCQDVRYSWWLHVRLSEWFLFLFCFCFAIHVIEPSAITIFPLLIFRVPVVNQTNFFNLPCMITFCTTTRNS